MKRSPSRHCPASVRALTRARSASEMPTSALWRAPMRERLRGLAEHRGQQHVVDHHRQREPAGEAHADRADARAAAARVLGGGQRAQPRRDRARPLEGEAGELPRDAGGHERAHRVATGRRPAGIAEEVRHDRGAAGGDHPPAEDGELGRDARGLAHHDDGRTVPGPEDVAALAFGLEALLGVSRERGLPPADVAAGHGGTVASPFMPGPGRTLDPRLPVLVGLGAVDDGTPAADLMERAARAAADDAGAPELLDLARPHCGAPGLVVARRRRRGGWRCAWAHPRRAPCATRSASRSRRC